LPGGVEAAAETQGSPEAEGGEGAELAGGGQLAI